MEISRRKALMSALFGTGYVGLRALATGLPASLLLKGRRAFADAPDATCAGSDKAQFVIMSTASSGCAINAGVPGTFGNPNIHHNPDPGMAQTALKLAGKSFNAAKPWATLPQQLLDRTCFWHLMTDTPVHPKEPDVLRLMNATDGGEMLASLLAKQLAPCLGTAQMQPISIGAAGPSEALTFGGRALPIVPPLALKATLANAPGPLTNLQALRDQTLNELADVYRDRASKAQRDYLDSLITSQTQIRSLNQNLLAALDSIKDNGVDAQVTAAVALVMMKVTPVVTIHIPFSGDNHSDPGLANEARQTIAGVASIASLFAQLETAKLADSVSFMTLNVFGRTLGLKYTNGRNHNANHQVSVTIGKPFKGGVIGGIAPVEDDFGAVAINSSTGQGGAGGDISPKASLAAFGKTMLAAVGATTESIDKSIRGGKVVTAALA